MVYPVLQIRGSPGHPDPGIRGGGGGQLKKFGPQFGLKISGLGPRATFLDPPLRSSGQRKRKFEYLTPLS